MNGPIRTLRHLSRLAIGGLRYGLARPPRPDASPLLATDIFATLISRKADDDAAIRGGTLAFARMARDRGLAIPADIFALRRRCERKLIDTYRHSGRDPDFTNRAIFLSMAVVLEATDPETLAEQASQAEADWERLLTEPIPALQRWVDASIADGGRVIAISDTRYSSDELRHILSAHGYANLAEVYSSADHAASKFTGRLFDVVADAEAVAHADISHRGDNWLADILSPAHRGVRVLHIPPPPLAVAAAPLPRPAQPADKRFEQTGFRVGFESLGPIYAAFARMVLAQAYLDGVDHLAFVARDGDLPMQATQILADRAPEAYRPKISYTYLSRRSTRDLETPSGDLTEHGRKVIRYLEQSGVFNAGVAMVDVGWRGTIHERVCNLATNAGKPLPRAYYLALWNEDQLPAADERTLGMLGDQRRDRGPREGAAWYCALMLEAISRASHGTVLDYEVAEDGQIRPVLADTGQTRAAEIGSIDTQRSIREGVLAYCRTIAELDGTAAPPDFAKTRKAAQDILFRLAFFPNKDERAVGRHLVHSESTDDFSATLLQRPGRGLKGWILSLRSPWKGAAFRQAGGVPLAAAYLLLEAGFCYLPLGLKTKLREKLGPPPNDANA